jgi:hypothetical protein
MQKHEQMQSVVQRVASSTEEVAWDDEEGPSPPTSQPSKPGDPYFWTSISALVGHLGLKVARSAGWECWRLTWYDGGLARN